VAGTEYTLRIDRLVKRYHGLRPLRLASLLISPGERVTIGGIDAPAAELLVNLITGAAVPDEGEVWVFGRQTAEITNADEWLTWLDHFGIVSERGVLLEGATVEQNLAMPFSLDIDPVPPDVAKRVAALARECGLGESVLSVPAGELPADARLRTHLARAIALAPELLVLEHPTGRIADPHRAQLAADISRICDSRRVTALIITNDERFAPTVARRNLTLDAATGQVRPLKKGWFR
jgi:macrolide transport system ATP-binding/permease protein